MSRGKHYRGPKRFTPPDAYQPGSITPPAAIATPQRSETMGLATIIEDFSVPAKPMPQAPPPHKAGVLHLAQDGTPLNPRTMPPPALPEADKAPDHVVVQSSRAKMVFDTPVETEEAAPAPVGDAEPENEVEKVRLNAQRKITELGQQNSALQQQLNDILAATLKKQPDIPTQVPTQSVDITALRNQLKEVAKGFLDDPEGTSEKMADLNAKIAQASIMPIIHEREQQSKIEATKALNKQYPGLIANRAEAAYVDTAAEMLAQEEGLSEPTMDHLQKAMDAYAKKVGWSKPSTAPQANAEVERMKQEASSVAPAGSSSPGKSKGKIWRKSELDALLTRSPEKYRDLQPEIMRAYREGRVR